MHSNLTIDELCNDLRRQIVDRVLPPGSKISETSLCQRWKVSRTPVREILRRLEAEGFISSARYKGFIVQRITIEDVDQLYTIKISLEGLAGRLATPIIWGDPQKMNELNRLYKEMQDLSKKGNIEGYAKKNREFHYLIWNSCQNKWLIKILQNLDSQIHRFIIGALHVLHRMEKSLLEHGEILEKIKANKGREVEKAIGNHFHKALEDLKRELVLKI
jgi:DNA-binding GntR family transcriptional regulator